MKVYFVGSDLQGCYAVRCLFPLQANGWDGDQTSIRIDMRTPENKAKAAQDADVIVFHRPDHPKKLELARLLKKNGKKIVFDNDDTFKDDGGFKFNEFMDKKRLERGLSSINATIDSFIKESDLVTCSTDFLRKEYEQLSTNVRVLPNCIDPFLFDEPIKNETDVVRIGMTGSVAITSDLDRLRPLVEHYHKNPKVKMVLFSMPPANHDKITRELYWDEYKFWESVNVEWQPFVDMQDYYQTLNELRLDMLIIPRADNYFNRCKSNIKFLEASMLQIPVIAQSFQTGDSPYEVDKEDAEHLILATDTNDWIQKIDSLIEDKEKRVEMGEKAQEYVIGKYDIEKNAHKWVEAYQSLWK